MGRVPPVLVGVRAGVTLFNAAELSVTIDSPVTHTSRGVSGHMDLAVPVFKTAQHEIIVTGTVHALGALHADVLRRDRCAVDDEPVPAVFDARRDRQRVDGARVELDARSTGRCSRPAV